MRDDELIERLRSRAADPSTRIDMADVSSPRLFPVACAEDVARAEKALTFKLPTLLRRIYLEVANGGFGPGYGLLGIYGGHTDDEARTIVEASHALEVDTGSSKSGLRAQIAPICEWGSAIWSCIDCVDDAATIITSDDVGLTQTPHNLRSWLETWVNGRSLWDEMFEFSITEITNPTTGKPAKVRVRGPARGHRISLWEH